MTEFTPFCVQKSNHETFNIEEYLLSLSCDINTLDISCLELTYIPPLSRFTHLKIFNCYKNKLSSLPELPETIEILNCSGNCLTSLPKLPDRLKTLYCTFNKLITLPKLPEKIEVIYCCYNELETLPPLPQNLLIVKCNFNKLQTLPKLPPTLSVLCIRHNKISLFQEEISPKLKYFCVNENPLAYIYNIPTTSPYNTCVQLTPPQINNIREIQFILNKFRFLFYSLKYKSKLRKILYEKIREPIAQKKYHPDNLVLLLIDEETSLDDALDKW